MTQNDRTDLLADVLPPSSGYWVECVPLRPRSWLHLDPGLYAASIDGIPGARGLGISPDRAIEKLQRRLAQIRSERVEHGVDLPPTHSRLVPPKRLQNHIGWMSVFVAVEAQNDQKSTFP